jgi:hypothetical protein
VIIPLTCLAFVLLLLLLMAEQRQPGQHRLPAAGRDLLERVHWGELRPNLFARIVLLKVVAVWFAVYPACAHVRLCTTRNPVLVVVPMVLSPPERFQKFDCQFSLPANLSHAPVLCCSND